MACSLLALPALGLKQELGRAHLDVPNLRLRNLESFCHLALERGRVLEGSTQLSLRQELTPSPRPGHLQGCFAAQDQEEQIRVSINCNLIHATRYALRKPRSTNHYEA